MIDRKYLEKERERGKNDLKLTIILNTKGKVNIDKQIMKIWRLKKRKKKRVKYRLFRHVRIYENDSFHEPTVETERRKRSERDKSPFRRADN